MADTLRSKTVYNNLIHGKTNDGEDMIILPYTKYSNVLGAPSVVSEIDKFKGAPFFFYQTDEVEVDQEKLEEMLGLSFTA